MRPNQIMAMYTNSPLSPPLRFLLRFPPWCGILIIRRYGGIATNMHRYSKQQRGCGQRGLGVGSAGAGGAGLGEEGGGEFGKGVTRRWRMLFFFSFSLSLNFFCLSLSFIIPHFLGYDSLSLVRTGTRGAEEATA